MNWTDVHAVLKHLKNVDMPEAERQFETAKKELAEFTKQKGRKKLQMKRAEAAMRRMRLGMACESLGQLRIGDTVEDD